MKFSEKLKRIRIEKNVTQDMLSKALGLNRSTISSYESDRNQPDLDTLVKIAKYFNVSTDYLLDISDIKVDYNSLYQIVHSDKELSDFLNRLSNDNNVNLRAITKLLLKLPENEIILFIKFLEEHISIHKYI
jgi:transcriptional regulator with XRE-family HTH domain